MDLVAAHAAALDSTRRIVAGIDQAQLSLPTPCEHFDVEALLGHLVVGNRRFVAVAGGAPATSVPLEPEPTDDWSAAYDSSATAVGEAWRDPAALERIAELPIGSVPGVVALGMHVVESLVHGWDLAKATGQGTDIDPVLCAIAWRNVQGVNDDLRGAGRPFGSAIGVPDDAPATDRLVAWLGRQP
jgi:uncharacterized protein (TIGR03086 family)